MAQGSRMTRPAGMSKLGGSDNFAPQKIVRIQDVIWCILGNFCLDNQNKQKYMLKLDKKNPPMIVNNQLISYVTILN